MRAILLLLLILAAVAFASLYHSALRPYWDERLPRVMSHLGAGEFREAASAMVDEAGDAPAPAMSVTTSSARPDTFDQSEGVRETTRTDSAAAVAPDVLDQAAEVTERARVPGKAPAASFP